MLDIFRDIWCQTFHVKSHTYHQLEYGGGYWVDCKCCKNRFYSHR